MVLALIPRALIFRLFLAPNEARGIGVALQRHFQKSLGERIQLFDAHDGDVAPFGLAAFLQEVIVDLAAAQNHSLDFVWFQFVDFRYYHPESALGYILER